MNFLQNIDSNVTGSFKVRGLKLRCAGSGLWLILLLPSALLSGIRKGNVSQAYHVVSVVSMGLAVNAICGILSTGVFLTDRTIPFIQIGYLLSSTVVSLLLVFLTEWSTIFSLFCAIFTSISYHTILETILRLCPRSFTFGEATVVTQSLILYLTSFATNTFFLFGCSVQQCEETASYIVQTGYFAVLVMFIMTYRCEKLMRQTWTFIFTLGVSFFTFITFFPYLIIQKNSLLWLFQLMRNSDAVVVIILWILCCSCAVYCLVKQTNKQKPASSTIRKIFHFLMFFVLMPGLIICPCLMYIASGVAFAILVIIETCRTLQLTQYWKVLQLCFDTFKDSKDEGQLALTPLYLMIGCVAPFWMYPYSFSGTLPLPVISGILSVAIGDAAASICGTEFGKHQWSNSCKTKEGTAGCFLSQILVLLFFSFTDSMAD